MSEKIAVDAGHGFTKALSADGHQAIFPSLICSAPPTVDLGEFGQRDVVQIDGAPYLVGESARNHATPLWSKEKATDPDTLRLILVAIAQLGASGPIALATGLPLAWFGSQKTDFRQALTGYGASIALPDQPTQQIWIESALVLPQGVAAAGPVLGSPQYRPGPYLVIDVGYRTTDFIIVTKESTGEFTFDLTAAGSLEVGMHAVTVGLLAELADHYRISMKAGAIEGRDFIFVRGQSIALTGLRARYQRQAVQTIAQGLAEALDSQLDQLAGIVAVGGGSELFAANVPGVLTPSASQWANGQGYALALGLGMM